MKSPLINELLESQLKTLLERVSAPVALTCVAGESEKDAEMVLFLRHFAMLWELMKKRHCVLLPLSAAEWDVCVRFAEL
jgi:alkyl hydroperoxide reductase subunit AhpF